MQLSPIFRLRKKGLKHWVVSDIHTYFTQKQGTFANCFPKTKLSGFKVHSEEREKKVTDEFGGGWNKGDQAETTTLAFYPRFFIENKKYEFINFMNFQKNWDKQFFETLFLEYLPPIFLFFFSILAKFGIKKQFFFSVKRIWWRRWRRKSSHHPSYFFCTHPCLRPSLSLN